MNRFDEQALRLAPVGTYTASDLARLWELLDEARKDREEAMRALSRHDGRSWCAVCGHDHVVCDGRPRKDECLGSRARRLYPRTGSMEVEHRYCPDCGKPKPEGSAFCTFCGKRVDGARDQTPVRPSWLFHPDCTGNNRP